MRERHGKVLVVDDDEAFRALVVPVLRGHGFDVVEAASGRQGVEMLESEHPDVAVVEDLLPDTDGLRWVHDAHELERESDHHVKIALLSGSWRDPVTVERLTRELGVEVAMHKPVTPGVLLAHLDRLFGISSEEEPWVGAPPEIEEQIQRLRAGFAANLPGRLARLQEVIDGARQDNGVRRRYARALVYKLRGTAGSYGFTDVTTALESVERSLEKLADASPGDAELLWHSIDAAMEHAEDAARQTADHAW